MKYTVTITCETNPQPHPHVMLQHASHGFHPTYLDHGQIALRAYDRAAHYQDELDYVMSQFLPTTHLMRAGW